MKAVIMAGIVLYEPELERLKENLEAVLPQVSKVVLVDNGSSNIKQIEALIQGMGRVTLLKNGDNRGIAAALNQAVAFMLSEGCAWILTLDQDSVCDPGLVAAYLPYLDTERVAMLAPVIIDRNEASGSSMKKLEQPMETERVITSACLLKTACCSEIGGFDEQMFIDYVDFDLCTRLIQGGYRILQVPGAVLYHEMGRAKLVKSFWILGKLLPFSKLKRPHYVYEHSPLRTYYYARNSVYYMRKHGESIDLKTEQKILRKWMLMKLAFESEKIRKAKAIFYGLRDGKRMDLKKSEKKYL